MERKLNAHETNFRQSPFFQWGSCKTGLESFDGGLTSVGDLGYGAILQRVVSLLRTQQLVL